MKAWVKKCQKWLGTTTPVHKTEAPTYNSTTLVTAIGGAISLYLGMSIAMIFEVIELIIDCIVNLLC